MNKTAQIITAHALIALLYLGCIKACNQEFANQDALIEQRIEQRSYQP